MRLKLSALYYIKAFPSNDPPTPERLMRYEGVGANGKHRFTNVKFRINGEWLPRDEALTALKENGSKRNRLDEVCHMSLATVLSHGVRMIDGPPERDIEVVVVSPATRPAPLPPKPTLTPKEQEMLLATFKGLTTTLLAKGLTADVMADVIIQLM